MKSKFKKFIIANKGFAVFYLIWLFINLILFILEPPHFIDSAINFWPFGSSSRIYYTGDFFFYLVIPLVLWGVWMLIGADFEKQSKD